MADQNHRIFRLEFDLSMPGNETPSPIQDRVSRLLQNELTRLINDIFSEFVAPDEFYILDQLVLDLGTIRIESLEEDIPRVLKTVLRDSLGKLFQNDQQQQLVLRRPVSSSQLTILSELLVRGAYPWWVTSAERRTPSDLLKELSTSKTSELIDLLVRILKREFARKRVVITYNDDELKQVVRLLEPSAFPFMEDFPDDLQRQHQDTPLLSTSQVEFRIIQWDLILEQIVDQRGSVFNQRSFVKQILLGLAAKFGEDYKDLLFQLLAVVDKIETSSTPSVQLVKSLRDLVAEEKLRQPKDSEREKKKWLEGLVSAFPASAHDVIRKTLLQLFSSSMAVPPFRNLGRERWQLITKVLWQTEPAILLRLIKRLAWLGSTGRDYLRHIPAKLLRQILRKTQSGVLATEWLIYQDFLLFGKTNLIPNWKNAELRRELVAHLLIYVVAPAPSKYDNLIIWKTAIHRLIGTDRAVLRTWLKQILNDPSPMVEQEKLSTPTLSTIEALAIEYQLEYNIDSAQWVSSDEALSLKPPSTDVEEEQIPITAAADIAESDLEPDDIPALLLAELSKAEQEKLAAHIRLVINFFRTGQRPVAPSSQEIEKSWWTWAERSPRSLIVWLQDQRLRPSFAATMTTVFSPNLAKKLFSLLAPASYSQTLLLEASLQNIGYWSTKNQAAASTLWSIIWLAWQQLPSNTFSTRQFIEKIIAQLDQQFLVQQIQDSKTITQSLQQDSQYYWLLNLVEKLITTGSRAPQFPTGKTEELSVEDWIVWLQGAGKKASPAQVTSELLRWVNMHKQPEIITLWMLINEQPAIQDIIAQYLAEKELLAIVRRLNLPLADRLLDIVITLQTVNKRLQGPVRPVLVPALTKLILQALAQDRGSISNQRAFFLQLIQLWSTSHQHDFKEVLITLKVLLPELAGLFHDLTILELLRTIVAEELSEQSGPDSSQQSAQKDQTRKPRPSSIEDSNRKKLWDVEDLPLIVNEAWQIENAGLVLLWPYFSALFERAEFITNETFTNEDAQQKAVLLMEYLIKGNQEYQEYELVLNKVLCGLRLEIPITSALVLNPELESLVEGLLEAVISHWSILGETSISTFRESFLQREGSLSLTDKGWILQVAPKSYDIMLRQLPWGISTVNLSWLEEPIQVDWNS